MAKNGRRYQNLFYNWSKFTIGKRSNKPICVGGSGLDYDFPLTDAT